MLFGMFDSSEKNRKGQDWEPVGERELRLRKHGKRVVSVEECGKIIGKIVSPVEGDVIGRWCGAVYLTRD